MALNITLLNLMGMACDHFVAILLPLQCHCIMSKTKSKILIGSFWITAILCGFSDFLSVIPERDYLEKYNFCELTYLTPYHDEYTVFAIAFLCFLFMGIIYVRIYIKIHERQKSARSYHEDHRWGILIWEYFYYLYFHIFILTFHPIFSSKIRKNTYVFLVQASFYSNCNTFQ